MRKIRYLSAMAAVLAALATPAVAAPQYIQCAYARTPVEKTICGTPEILALNLKMTDLYFKIYDHSSREERQLVTASQSAWIGRLYGCGYDAGCIIRMHGERIDFLAGVLADGY